MQLRLKSNQSTEPSLAVYCNVLANKELKCCIYATVHF